MTFNYEYFQPSPIEFPIPFSSNEELREWVRTHTFQNVFTGEVEAPIVEFALEQLFSLHNQDYRPRRSEIPSMSVGMVVRLHQKTLFEVEWEGIFIAAPLGWVPLSELPKVIA
jgi:hypothetical protein